jgi:hypothetical protein
MADLALEAIFKRDNTVTALALLALMLLACLARLAGAGTGMDPFGESAYWLIAFFMWT